MLITAGENKKWSGGSLSVRHRGLTLIEVMVSILLVTTVVTAAMMARYLSVKQARRADAYNGAGRVAQLLLEGWRSHASPELYTPITDFAGYFDTFESGTGPASPTGFTDLAGYHIVLDNINFYVTLAYITQTSSLPAALHVGVAFRHQYDAGTISTSDNIVRLTTYD